MKISYFDWLRPQLLRSCSHSAWLNPWLLSPLQLPSGVWSFKNARGQLVTLQT